MRIRYLDRFAGKPIEAIRRSGLDCHRTFYPKGFANHGSANGKATTVEPNR
jgi:hypothetical protein